MFFFPTIFMPLFLNVVPFCDRMTYLKYTGKNRIQNHLKKSENLAKEGTMEFEQRLHCKIDIDLLLH